MLKHRQALGSLAVLLLATCVIVADDPCYGLLNENEVCPSLGPSATCESINDPEGCILSEYTYNSRKSGPYKCDVAPAETGKKCVAKLDPITKDVLTEQCGQVYWCDPGVGLACKKGDPKGQPYYANLYTTDKTGCRTPLPPGGGD